MCPPRRRLPAAAPSASHHVRVSAVTPRRRAPADAGRPDDFGRFDYKGRIIPIELVVRNPTPPHGHKTAQPRARVSSIRPVLTPPASPSADDHPSGGASGGCAAARAGEAPPEDLLVRGHGGGGGRAGREGEPMTTAVGGLAAEGRGRRLAVEAGGGGRAAAAPTAQEETVYSGRALGRRGGFGGSERARSPGSGPHSGAVSACCYCRRCPQAAAAVGMSLSPTTGLAAAASILRADGTRGGGGSHSFHAGTHSNILTLLVGLLWWGGSCRGGQQLLQKRRHWLTSAASR